MTRRARILVSAYACNPAGDPHLHPGEDLVGWHLVGQLAKVHEVWVITHAYNRPEIERAGGPARTKAHFLYVKLPSFVRLLYRVSFGERIYYYLWQILAWRTAVRLHKRIHFDLAHHLTFGNYWMPSFIGAFLPVPFIWGPIGGGQKIPRVFFKEFSLMEKLSEWGRDAAQWVGRNLLLSRRICMSRAKAILVCNRETKAMFPKKYWPKISYFPVNGISPSELARRAPALHGKAGLRLLTAGRLIRLKAFDIVVRAFALARREDPRARLEIVGQGPEEPALRRLASELGLGRSVSLVPWLSRESLLKRMRASDGFVFASLRDGGGAVVVEAMASGIPVVCLNLGGPGFHIRDQWGIKVNSAPPERVVEEMARAILRLDRDPALRQRLGRRGWLQAKDAYLWDRLGERLARIEGQVARSGRTVA
jgi:glycosyltransferase involved in cell wall biosynthesis